MNTTDMKFELILQGIITPDNKLHVKYLKKLQNDPLLVEEIKAATHYLQYDAPMKTRIHCIIQELEHQPVCVKCGSILKMRLSGKYRFTFPKTCGSKCFSGLDSVKEKRKKTNIQRYNSTNYLSSTVGKEATKQSLLQKYKVSNAGQIQKGREKREKTILQKYGSMSTYYNEVNQKRIKTMQQNHNVDNAMNDETLKNKQQESCLKNHGVTNSWYSADVQDKRKNTMIDKYNTEIPLRNKEIREKFENTMIHKYGVSYYSSSKCSPESLKLLNNKQWLTEQHHALNKTTVKIAQELCVSPSTVLRYLHHFNIEIMKSQTSQFERDIQLLITNILINDTVLTNVRDIIPPLELDIYIPSKQLAFEINGTFWHSELNGKNKKYHINKTQKCEENGIRLIHITDYEWEFKQQIVISRINNLLQKSTRIFARKCNIVSMSSAESTNFFEHNHIQGNVGSSIRYGLEYQGKIVAAMTFGKSRFSKKYQYELIRAANCLNTTVVGGASKLFKHFIKTHAPDSIITFSDKRWNTGQLYKTLGFVHTHSSEPNYRYFKPNSLLTFSRQKFQKHKLKNILPIFDPNLSEWKNMTNNGFDRIWDCGNDVYEWKVT